MLPNTEASLVARWYSNLLGFSVVYFLRALLSASKDKLSVPHMDYIALKQSDNHSILVCHFLYGINVHCEE